MKKATVAVGNRRLLMLAELLDVTPDDRFDYSQFVGDDWDGRPDLSCGTVACAIGWATTIPAFRRHGLRLDEGGSVIGAESHDVGDYLPGTALFAIDDTKWNYLFQPHISRFTLDDGVSPLGEHATAKQVAAHIRRFVAARSK